MADERTTLLVRPAGGAPMESVAKDHAHHGGKGEKEREVDPRVMQAAAELVEAVHSQSKHDKLQKTGAAVVAARIRSHLRLPEQCVSVE